MADLTGFLDRYLDALVAGDASTLPLAGDVRATENGYPVEPGRGVFETAGEVTYRHDVGDTTAGQVMTFAVVREGPLLANVAVRLAVARDRITEIETIVARKGGSSVARPDKLTAPDPRFAEPLDPADRPSREELAAIADSYFEGLETDDAGIVPFHPDCLRVENGQATTGTGPRGMGAREQFERKVFAYITDVRNRRYPIVDPDRGLAVAIVLMDVPARPEDLASFPVPLEELPTRMLTPRTILLAELFKITGGRIRAIEATMVNIAFRGASGW